MPVSAKKSPASSSASTIYWMKPPPRPARTALKREPASERGSSTRTPRLNERSKSVRAWREPRTLARIEDSYSTTWLRTQDGTDVGLGAFFGGSSHDGRAEACADRRACRLVHRQRRTLPRSRSSSTGSARRHAGRLVSARASSPRHRAKQGARMTTARAAAKERADKHRELLRTFDEARYRPSGVNPKSGEEPKRMTERRSECS